MTTNYNLLEFTSVFNVYRSDKGLLCDLVVVVITTANPCGVGDK